MHGMIFLPMVVVVQFRALKQLRNCPLDKGVNKDTPETVLHRDRGNRKFCLGFELS